MKAKRVQLPLTRREFLQTGAAAGLAAVSLRSAVAAPAAPASSAGGKPRLFLFLDWHHVNKGDLAVVLDPARINEAGRTLLDTYAREHGKVFAQGTHGFRPVDLPHGVRVRPEIATKSEPWLKPDQPWEKSIANVAVIFDEGRYRCWYGVRLAAAKTQTTVDGGRVMEVSGAALAYAESTNGVDWVKPALGILSYQGSKENNLVTPYHNGGAVFRDDHGSAEQRYKLFYFESLPKEEIPPGAPPNKRYGLFAVTSPDGLHWTRHPHPLVRYFSDTFNVGAWDAALQKYVGYFRHHLSGRTISRAETDDFWQWPEPQPLLYAGPLDAPADDFYTNGFTTYPGEPSVRLLFPGIYHHDSDAVDVRMGVSRDGRSYQWISYDPVVRLGPPGSWAGGSIYAQPNLVPLPDGRLALPFNAYSTTHNEIWFQTFYGDYGVRTTCGWAIWDESRLAGIEADNTGQFTTRAAAFDGTRIQINARTTQSGSVEVELREKGRPIEGCTFAEAVPFTGDKIWTDCLWRGRENLSSLQGRNLELSIRLRSAKIFAVRFA